MAGAADVGAFQRGQGHADDADPEAVLGNGLGLRNAQEQPPGAGTRLRWPISNRNAATPASG